MKCPVDGVTLEKHTEHSVEIEGCPTCGGVWLDKGELERARDATESDLRWMDFELWSSHSAFKAEWSTCKCPVCDKNMAAIVYGSTGVTIDYCVDEHGIWLDKGEFQAIVDALKDEMLTMDTPAYIAASLEEAVEILSGDEGLISEWKDFAAVTRMLQLRILVDNPWLAKLLIALPGTLPS